MKGSKKIGIAAAACLMIGSYAAAAPGNGDGSHGGAAGFGGMSAPGNSAFGYAQAGNAQTGSINSQYGQATAQAARSRSDSDSDDQDGNNHKKKNAKKHQKHGTAPGNSAFGRSQGGNPRKGSINSSYG